MALDDIKISEAIIKSFSEKLVDVLDNDVAIVGAGPAGLTSAYYMAAAGKKVAIFERKLSIGGGMWAGGIMFNEIVLQAEGKAVVEEFGVRTREILPGYFACDSVEAVTTIASAASRAGARIMNLFSVEDVLMVGEEVDGLVINWSAVEMGGLHVDPISVRAGFIVEATGHACEVARVIERKAGVRLNTPTGKVVGERPMAAEAAEKLTLENTKGNLPPRLCDRHGMQCSIRGAQDGPHFRRYADERQESRRSHT